MTLTTHHLNIGYGSYCVQHDLNLRLEEGEMVCMLGKNGCGKSTLLRTLSGLQPALSGKISMLHADSNYDIATMPARQRSKYIALVLTERESMASTRVEEIVAMGRYPHTNFMGQLSDADKHAIKEAMLQVGVENKHSEYFNCLSDGEKQRVLIAKAIAQQTPLILLDEPTAHLDLPNRIHTMRLLRILAHEQKKSIIISTHELDLAMQTADTVWLMSEQGVATGTPEELISSGAFQQAFADDSFTLISENGTLRFHLNTNGY